MNTYGFNVANTIRFREEEAFALAKDFTILQLWFDRRGLSLHELDGVQTVVRSRVKTIVHACIGLEEFSDVFTALLPILRILEHHELIVHSISSGGNEEEHHGTLVAATQHWLPIFEENNIAVYFENNSRLDPVLQTAEEVGAFFGLFPSAGFLLDVAHMDSYEHLGKLVETKMPQFLHVADRNLEVMHEHLAVGDGNIDFDRVFGECLAGFDSRIIFEVPWEPLARKHSKQRIEEAIAECC